MNVLSSYDLPSLHFNHDTYTLKEFLANLNHQQYQLPIIVNISALNNYGRSIKNILTKNTPLILLEIGQLDSVIADYYTSTDGYGRLQRNRLPLSHSKMVSKSTSRIRNIKKLSKSVASLSGNNRNSQSKGRNHPNGGDDDDEDDDDDENAYNLRAFVKLLNEKRSSSVSLCRIPAQYCSFFELLNADNESIEPYKKLSDLPEMEPDHEDADRRTDKAPVQIFLRRSCNAYRRKDSMDYLRTTIAGDYNSNLTASADSCYSSSSDLDTHKNALILNETPETLSAGQIIVLLDTCHAHRTHVLGGDIEQRAPLTPSSPHFSPISWMRSTSKIFSSRKNRHSNTSDSSSSEHTPRRVTFETFDLYMKCQTKQGHIMYIGVDEPVIFSPLSRKAHSSRAKASWKDVDISDVFKINDLLSNFRFPINVRLLDGPLSFDNIYAPALINRDDETRLTPTKFRLLGSHNERVVFACPLNKAALKASKSPISYILLPLSVNADIEIQPVANMSQIMQSAGFHRITEECSQIIKYYQAEITLVHFPLSLVVDPNLGKQALYKKRSQSVSYDDYFDEDSNSEYEQSAPRLSYCRQRRRRHSDETTFLTARSLHNRDSNNTTVEKTPADTVRQEPKASRSNLHVRIQDDRRYRSTRELDPDEENRILDDMDTIYDFIRVGDMPKDLKERLTCEQFDDDIPTSSSTTKTSNPFTPKINVTPGAIATHRFSPRTPDRHRQSQRNNDDDNDDGDGNVNSDQARTLYLAEKHRKKAQSQHDISHSNSAAKSKRNTKR
ncbi:unnamed protein product [Adineta ricciae]|uniref:CABIT domain-containing protein n=1 Tax=Adineta ricciae TaxID=249248 RepID=A0A815G2B8_ADIRI|nr:unnamed protein product [Adineta ricciae]